MISHCRPLCPRDFARELEQRMLRWGRDVTSPHGNLLLRHGFTRLRAPDQGGSSRYRLAWRDRQIELHSSCVTLCGGGRPGLRYVRRSQRVYLCSAPEPPPPGDRSDAALILPFRPDEMASFRSAAAEFRSWLDRYSAWRFRVPTNSAAIESSAPGPLAPIF